MVGRARRLYGNDAMTPRSPTPDDITDDANGQLAMLDIALHAGLMTEDAYTIAVQELTDITCSRLARAAGRLH